MKKILQNWVGKDLPLLHVNTNGPMRKVIADLIIHPIKRRIAKYYCYVLQKCFGLTVIGITGSAGKTTTKEMIAGVLRLSAKTVWSKDNIDPIFNIPTTILRCTPKTKYLILEMGVEYPGEMDFYLWLVKPKIGVITNIFPSHTLYLKDINGVFEEKSKLAKKVAISVLNKDDVKLLLLKNKINANIFWFKSDENPIIQNSNTARVVGQVLKVEQELIERGLKNYQNPKHRLTIIKHKSGATIFDDTYNSNPEAFKKSLNYFLKLAGKNDKLAVVGDMLELGEIEEEEHKKIGKEIQNKGFVKIIGVGKLVKFMTDDIYLSPLEALPEIKKYLRPKTFIFIKGSRSIGLDKIVDRL
ncbi:MAG TPA: Mur ligase family protein [Patescibacteria group bacterium]|nr:Mur ligase family protein [Patescibacteria group bacterium]